MRALFAIVLLPVSLLLHGAALAQSGQPAAGPTIRAILVGASDFRDSSLPPLVGARNDAMLMAATLVQRGARPDNIELLIDQPELAPDDYRNGLRASGVTVSGLPVREQILQAFARLAANTHRGDQVVVLLDGHGEQQQAMQKGTEFADLDQVFLPEDAAFPQGYQAADHTRIGNAIIDDEIGAALDAIRAKGGNVFFIADFCHSGGSTRAAASDGPPRPFMIPPTRVGPDAGSLVAFFAAPADEKAKQSAVPYWSDTRRPHSVLTYYTASALNEDRSATYDDLFQLVNAKIIQQADAEGTRIALPTPEGDTGRAVLGKPASRKSDSAWTVLSPAGDGVAKTRLTALTLRAGSLVGIVPGTIFSIAVNTDEDQKVQMYGRASSVSPLETTIVPTAYDGIGTEAWNDVQATYVKSGTDWKPAPLRAGQPLTVRIAAAPVRQDFAVALPGAASARTAAERRALAAMRRLPLGELGARVARRGDHAGLTIALDGGAVSFLNPDGWRYGRISLADMADAELRERMAATIKRAARLAQIRAGLGELAAESGPSIGQIGTGGAADAPIQVQFFVRRATEPAAPGAECPAARDFQQRVGANTPRPTDAVPLDLRSAQTLHKCDEIYYEIRNNSDEPWHIQPVIIAPEGAVMSPPAQSGGSTLFQRSAAGSNGYLLTTDPGTVSIRDEFFLVVMKYEDQDHGSPLGQRLSQPPIACVEAGPCDDSLSRGSGANAVQMAPRFASLFGSLLSGTRGAPLPSSAAAARFSWYTAPQPAAR